MKFALVGCGGIAAAHAAALSGRADAEIAAAVDPVGRHRRIVAVAHGCEEFECVDALLDETHVDAACVCTPPGTHREIVEKLLRRGVDVLCEKPLATSFADARAMAAIADDTSRALAVSSKFRFVDDLAEARRLIDAGAIGHPVDVSIGFCAPLDASSGWHATPDLSGGGVIMDNAPHVYDVLSVLFEGSPKVVGAVVDRTGPDRVEETARLLFSIPDGPIGAVSLSWAYLAPHFDYAVVNGTSGSLRVGWMGGAVRSSHRGEWTEFGRGYDKKRAFDGLIGRFIRSVRGEVEPEPLTRALAAIRFIEDAYRLAPLP